MWAQDIPRGDYVQSNPILSNTILLIYRHPTSDDRPCIRSVDPTPRFRLTDDTLMVDTVRDYKIQYVVLNSSQYVYVVEDMCERNRKMHEIRAGTETLQSEYSIAQV